MLLDAEGLNRKNLPPHCLPGAVYNCGDMKTKASISITTNTFSSEDTTHLLALTLPSHPKATALDWTFFSSQLPGTHQPFTIPEMDPHGFMYVLCPKSWAVHQLQSREHCLPSGAQKFTDTTMANNELLNIWAKINWNHPIYVFNTINDSWSQQNKHDTISYD